LHITHYQRNANTRQTRVFICCSGPTAELREFSGNESQTVNVKAGVLHVMRRMRGTIRWHQLVDRRCPSTSDPRERCAV